MAKIKKLQISSKIPEPGRGHYAMVHLEMDENEYYIGYRVHSKHENSDNPDLDLAKEVEIITTVLENSPLDTTWHRIFLGEGNQTDGGSAYQVDIFWGDGDKTMGRRLSGTYQKAPITPILP